MDLFTIFCSLVDNQSYILLGHVFQALELHPGINSTQEVSRIMCCVLTSLARAAILWRLSNVPLLRWQTFYPNDHKSLTRLFVFATSLDSLDFYVPYRRLDWIPLPLLNVKESYAMLTTGLDCKSEKLLRLLAMDSGGHPRTISAMRSAVASLEDINYHQFCKTVW